MKLPGMKALRYLPGFSVLNTGPLDWGQLTLGIPLHRLGVDSLPVGVDMLVDERHQRSTLTSLASLVITARSLRRPPSGFTVHHLGAYK
eukprot:scaffold13297_cov41-Attheya_sp.AAC.1